MEDTITLTTNHSASSYGVPVLLIDGEVYGPGDVTPDGGNAAALVLAWAARFTGSHYSDHAAALAELAQLNAADRAFVLYLVGRLRGVKVQP